MVRVGGIEEDLVAMARRHFDRSSSPVDSEDREQASERSVVVSRFVSAL